MKEKRLKILSYLLALGAVFLAFAVFRISFFKKEVYLFNIVFGHFKRNRSSVRTISYIGKRKHTFDKPLDVYIVGVAAQHVAEGYGDMLAQGKLLCGGDMGA